MPLLERGHRLVQRVLEVVVLVVDQRFDGDVERLLVVEEAQGPDRFEPNARVLVVDAGLEQLERIRDAVAPVAEDAGGRGAGLRLGRVQQLARRTASTTS